MKQQSVDIRQKKRKRLVMGIVLLGVLLMTIFLLSKFARYRIDLTEEKRYSLHASTKEILEAVEEPLEVDILLSGKLPGGMRRFQQNIKATLETFNAYSGAPISSRYFDPMGIESNKEKEEYIIYLSEFGINPTNLFATENGTQTSRLIFPGVIIRNATHETGGLLLKGNRGMSPDQTLNLSVENLEYELINMIRKLTSREKRAVAMITNHGELQDDQGFGIVEALSEDYEVYKVPLQQAKSVEDLLSFDAVIVAGPRDAYSEREVYLLDQYLMRGGKLLLGIDPLAVDMEKAGGEGTVAVGFETGLDRMLYKYGVRINKDLIQDMNFGYYPVVAGEFGNQSQIVPLPWPFYVVANTMSDHVIVKGFDQVMFRMVSSLDTVKATGVEKTPLIFSGQYSRKMPQPVRVAFEDMSQEPAISLFDQSHLPLAYLLEGTFSSVYKDRFLPKAFEDDPDFRENSTGGALIVTGDGDWLQGLHDAPSGDPLPLGVDPNSEVNFANRELLQNMMKYLVDPDGIMATRSKELKIRPLDKKRVQSEKTMWQFINVALPVGVVLVIGLIKVYLRRRKYAVRR
ncbi:gliding motility-associated ABC transporter substrate-binding protein GldG [Echinicola soli]|uniref:Gliding motility-associated ABC transporter substrate-binding protein GldG n=1 Tax=Echinicola soli TaxID=2591634 RepID=A0A514CD80_9BACT|nr:gliding motility-associated ABC transporter substrate-binding protein GldG [Echinicola soli]QDH77779.1 gliding motility-associated ABC transporter substrate-binding protein GldG [Echinicola soli]